MPPRRRPIEWFRRTYAPPALALYDHVVTGDPAATALPGSTSPAESGAPRASPKFAERARRDGWVARKWWGPPCDGDYAPGVSALCPRRHEHADPSGRMERPGGCVHGLFNTQNGTKNIRKFGTKRLRSGLAPSRRLRDPPRLARAVDRSDRSAIGTTSGGRSGLTPSTRTLPRRPRPRTIQARSRLSQSVVSSETCLRGRPETGAGGAG